MGCSQEGMSEKYLARPGVRGELRWTTSLAIAKISFWAAARIFVLTAFEDGLWENLYFSIFPVGGEGCWQLAVLLGLVALPSGAASQEDP